MVAPVLTPEAMALMPKCIPGYTLEPEKEKFSRSQNFTTTGGVRVECTVPGSGTAEKQKMVRVPRTAAAMQAQLNASSKPTTYAQLHPDFSQKEYDDLPAWDALDRHVLRFYGYFREAVCESNMENNRVRRVIIYYYLDDDTMQIGETRVDNSGIPAGNLIRRHRIPKSDGSDEHIKADDIVVGMQLTIYGKTIKVIDCDSFTRRYAIENGFEQGDALPVPDDNFAIALANAKNVKAVKPRSYEKIYREAIIGGGHINTDMQQFMENDRKVCRFYAVIDDTLTAQYERRPATIFYYLANDTVEIREQYPLNCGRDNFPILFRRGKLEKAGVVTRGPYDPSMPGEYWKAEDLYVGLKCNMVATEFLIYDADPWTREWYKNFVGVEMGPRIDVKLPERELPRPSTPPYTGYGSWDDSMASVINLIPKVPRRDFHKIMYNEGKKLGFTAMLNNPREEDMNRRFIFQFDLQDDTVGIHEPPQRNSGIVGGRFLEKKVHLNQKTGRLFTPEDLLPGNVVQILNHEFLMLDMDEGTRKIMEAESTGVPQTQGKAVLDPILEKLRENMRQQFPHVRDIFRRFDKDRNGVITMGEMKEALQKFSFRLSDDEIYIIMRHFDTQKDGQISYNEFCDAILDPDYVAAHGTTGLSRELKVSMDGDDYKERAIVKTMMRSETEKVRRSARELSAIVYQNPGMQMKLIKEFASMTHQKEVTIEMIHAALLRLGFSFDLEDVERAVSFFVPGVNFSKIPYFYLIQQITASYHDLACVR
jgi:hypothetical protein